MAAEGDAGRIAEADQSRTDPVDLIQRAGHRGLSLSTAESLTAGALASRIAEVPGASAVLAGGVVSYSNRVKNSVLAVPAELLERRGPVDPDVAALMAIGTASACGTDLGVATTGVAGPDPHGGHDVGTVYIGVACTRQAAEKLGLSLPADCTQFRTGSIGGSWVAGSVLLNLDGDRAAIRDAAVEAGLKLVEDLLLTEPAGLENND